MKIEQQLLKPGHRCRPGGSYKVLSITIHSTGNAASTAKNERLWLDNPTNNRDASWHYVVGDGIVIQAIPDSEEAWHAGNKEGNRYSIGVEIIESGDRKAVIATAAEFVAKKVKEYGLTMQGIKKHYDWTGKNCPRILIDPAYVKDGMDWKYFLKLVENNLNEDGDGEMEKEKRFQKIEELPEWAQGTIKKLVAEGKIVEGNKLDLTLDMVRVLVILGR